MPLLTNSFEGGTNGAQITAAGSGGTSGNAFDSISRSTGASATWDDTVSAHGTLSAMFTTGSTSGDALIQWTASEGTQTTIFFRAYVYLPSSSASAFRFFQARNGTNGSVHCGSVYILGQTMHLSFGATFSGGTAFTTPIPIGQWVRVEGFVTGDAVAGAVGASLYTSMDSTTAAESHAQTGINTTGPITAYWFGQGNVSVNSGPFWLDDIGVSPTGYLGPVGGPPGVLLTNTAEGIASGTTVTTANSGRAGNPFDVVTLGTGSALSFDNTYAAHGSQAYKVVTPSPAANSFIQWTNTLTAPAVPVTQVWFRVYVYLTAYSTHQQRIVSVRSGTTYQGGPAIDSTGHIALLSATGGGIKFSTSTVPLNQWFRLEGYVLGDPSVGQIECKMFTSSMDEVTPDETVTTAATVNTGGPINRIDIGNPSSEALYTFWMDDLGASTSGYIGPAGTPLIPSLFPAFLC